MATTSIEHMLRPFCRRDSASALSRVIVARRGGRTLHVATDGVSIAACIVGGGASTLPLWARLELLSSEPEESSALLAEGFPAYWEALRKSAPSKPMPDANGHVSIFLDAGLMARVQRIQHRTTDLALAELARAKPSAPTRRTPKSERAAWEEWRREHAQRSYLRGLTQWQIGAPLSPTIWAIRDTGHRPLAEAWVGAVMPCYLREI